MSKAKPKDEVVEKQEEVTAVEKIDELKAQVAAKVDVEADDGLKTAAPTKKVGERVYYGEVPWAADVTRVTPGYGVDLLILDPDHGPKVKKGVRYSETPKAGHWSEAQ